MSRNQWGGPGGPEWVDSLCALLLLQSLPSSALWGIGWLLLQLLGVRKAGMPPQHLFCSLPWTYPCLLLHACPHSSPANLRTPYSSRHHGCKKG